MAEVVLLGPATALLLALADLAVALIAVQSLTEKAAAMKATQPPTQAVEVAAIQTALVAVEVEVPVAS